MCVVCGREDGTETPVGIGEASDSVIVVVCEDCRADDGTPPATVAGADDGTERPSSGPPVALRRRPSPVCECRECERLYNATVNGNCPFCRW